MEPTKVIEKDTTQDISFFEFIELLLANWRWIVVSLAITLGYAIIYLQKTPPIYSRSATVLITNDYVKSTESVLDEKTYSYLQESHDVENEILFFKSNRIMPEVAKRLKLDISYSQSGMFRDYELYKNSPVFVKFLDAKESDEFMFKITPLNRREAVLSHFYGLEEEKTQQISFNDTIMTPIGRMVAEVTPNLTKELLYTPINVVKYDVHKISQMYNQGLQITPISKDSRAISLTLNDVSPERATDIINMVITVYSEEIVQERNKIGLKTATFLNQRIMEIENELSGVDYNIAEFKNKNQHLEEEILIKEKEELREKVTDFENQLSLAEYVYSYLIDTTKSYQIIPSNMGISDINIERQIDTYNKLLFQRNKLIGNSSRNNPVIDDLDNSLFSMKQTIIKSTENYIAGLDIKLENAQVTEQENLARMAEVPAQQKYILTAQRRQKTTESLYLYLLNKREENALGQLIAEGNIRIIDPAIGSEYPISPRTNFIILLAIIFGVSFPTGVIYLFFIFDTRVKERKDIESNLSVPFLGEIPFYKRQKGEEHRDLVVRENSQDTISEAFRILRTNLEFMKVNRDRQQVIMFSSLKSDAGKTFIACNLGMMLALTGKKVILVDLDIRKGSLSSHFEKNKLGITNYLVGNVNDPQDLIHNTGSHPNLDVILKGPMPPNPAELLLSPLLDEIVEWLRTKYDYVILDNVPSNTVADARIVNRVADITLYVVRKGKLDKRMLPEIESIYTNKILKNMAIILNGVDYIHNGYGYSYRMEEKHTRIKRFNFFMSKTKQKSKGDKQNH